MNLPSVIAIDVDKLPPEIQERLRKRLQTYATEALTAMLCEADPDTFSSSPLWAYPQTAITQPVPSITLPSVQPASQWTQPTPAQRQPRHNARSRRAAWKFFQDMEQEILKVYYPDIDSVHSVHSLIKATKYAGKPELFRGALRWMRRKQLLQVIGKVADSRGYGYKLSAVGLDRVIQLFGSPLANHPVVNQPTAQTV